MRSGFVAGDARVLEKFLLYRTYHMVRAMSLAIQAASVAAWDDEAHVEHNRQLYAEKFAAATVTPVVAQALDACACPRPVFICGRKVPGDDAEFARELYREQHVTVLPGSYLARDAHGVNPGAGYTRIALVAPLAECQEAAERLVTFARSRA